MIGLYIFLAIIVVGIGAFVFIKIKWSAAERKEKRGQSDSIKQTKMRDDK